MREKSGEVVKQGGAPLQTEGSRLFVSLFSVISLKGLTQWLSMVKNPPIMWGYGLGPR